MLGAWNTVQLVEFLLLPFMPPKAVYDACCILGPARIVLGRGAIISICQWVDRDKVSADNPGCGWKPCTLAAAWREVGGSGLVPKDPTRGL